MKRLSGWDAVLLYSETPNVHMHTLKLAVIELDDLGGATFGVEEFRKVIHGRLYKLDPFRYELDRHPVQVPPSDVAGEREVDLEYHVRPCTRRRARAAAANSTKPSAGSRARRWTAAVRCGRCTSSKAWPTAVSRCSARSTTRWPTASRRRTCWPAAWTCSEGPQADRDSYATDPAPSKGELVRTAFTDHLRQIGRLPSVVRYTAAGRGPGAQEPTQAVARN